MPWRDEFNDDAAGGTVRPRYGKPDDTGCFHEQRELEVLYMKVRNSYVAKQECVECGDVVRTVLETDDDSILELDDEEIIDKFGLEQNVEKMRDTGNETPNIEVIEGNSDEEDTPE